MTISESQYTTPSARVSQFLQIRNMCPGAGHEEKQASLWKPVGKKLVTPTGFEPVISAVKGRCPDR